ncbi:MAG: ribonuclease III [Lachnospiraceae bacterium]|nr:ribonuclease III [Lachnospiraceae bacterium]MBQ2577462.1 ribonuclease III [Lachnospiraceae bacterium]MBQ5483916.1 ribonuclease III [Lachnospiraceae bacterium]MCR4732489.1 ribonuclease III [Lachnospiraceae bacterium]MEE3355878.1 ribonuclease III domain-containing protein [Candidatus Weimeria sp.]
MEEGMMNLYDRVKERFALPEVDIRTYSPLALAFLGDGVFEILVRTLIVGEGNLGAGNLHGHSAHIVKASSQRKLLEAIEADLTEEEADVYRRGRNAKSPTRSKNASMADYRIATGYEVLLGYLYLQGRQERIFELVDLGLQRTGLWRRRT